MITEMGAVFASMYEVVLSMALNDLVIADGNDVVLLKLPEKRRCDQMPDLVKATVVVTMHLSS
ncbi:hypothetical protein FUT69_02395 [Xylella taiwanensis]|uniref:Uncharacterized protein n=1 Tax=Xylella taiwanensis TaxID=1444770 RepID=Z9JLS0_9GAMM|nr:hypothetical protein [Xylella taiwanensis]AXI84023.1 hypothetical protein AB672_08795 [Xylella taiwanensis]EWS79094.1 hypothetical protein AF72_02665 [Xylella taiwanensis]MCD8457138.1 hypothetical protein [Xylella taiwanensis]MCD8459546.1 hypothetical protein [Xylella taiwanensis]MCD8461586.1 hypothetical protein [Xylella taiwanensis]